MRRSSNALRIPATSCKIKGCLRPALSEPKRHPVKIHEYQAKSVLARFGVPVPRGEVAFTSAEAGDIARRLGGNIVVVKAQIHAGGRGKGGGVKLAKSPDEAEQLAKQMIGMTLVTHQTGPEGKKVSRVLIEEGLQIDRELYLSILIDRAAARPVVIASAAGGMDIEEVAAKQPEKILREYIDRGTGIRAVSGAEAGFRHGARSRSGAEARQAARRASTRRSSRPTRRSSRSTR